MIKNVELAPTIYPGWEVLIYISESCPSIPILEKMNCKLIIMPDYNGIDRKDNRWQWRREHDAMMWRYLILDELEKGDVLIIRDADSRLSKREADVVNHWLTTDYKACRIAENASHWNSFMMTGMAGFRGGVLTGVREGIKRWLEFYETLNHPWIFCDLEFNSQVLQPILQNTTIGYGHGHPNPLPELKEGERFIGDVYEGHWREEVYEPKKFDYKDIYTSLEAMEEIRRWPESYTKEDWEKFLELEDL